MISHLPLLTTLRLPFTPAALPGLTGGALGRPAPARLPARVDGSTIGTILNYGAATRFAEHALVLERQRREAFVSTLAHELRQPLSALMMAVEVVAIAPERAVEIMKRQIQQMHRMVEDLIDTTRWAEGKLSLRSQRLDVGEIARNAAEDAGSAVADRGHEFVVAIASEPLWVDADPQRLQQVLTNLLVNASRYTEPGGRITLEADRSATAITVRIRDTGCGIEAEALGHIFDLYSQVQPQRIAGLGIGLSVVRDIVTLHGGRIEARSQGQGLGSEFIVTLPCARPALFIEA